MQANITLKYDNDTIHISGLASACTDLAAYGSEMPTVRTEVIQDPWKALEAAKDEASDVGRQICESCQAAALTEISGEWSPLPLGTAVEFSDGQAIRRGKVNGLIEPQMPRPVREDTEFYPGGYIVGRYRVTPGYGHAIRPLVRPAGARP